MTDDKARLVGINHVALAVGDIDTAVAFYDDLFTFEMRGRTERSAFLDMGDQFLALSESDADTTDDHRHFGLVVDDAATVNRRLDGVDADPVDGGPDFRDPWGNYVQVVEYGDVQFTKADHVLAGMGLPDLDKTDDAVAELAEKGMAPEDRA
jgi:catechol 2,3-dioxygenase-like lactoylglutathione lyase family enzyme